jgi:AAA family ATP:ADP antiporter
MPLGPTVLRGKGLGSVAALGKKILQLSTPVASSRTRVFAEAAITPGSRSGSELGAKKSDTSSGTMKKVLPLGAMLFFILFNYTILRDTKDVLVITAPGSGAEIIPYLKTYVNLPSAIAFTVLYSNLSNKLNTEKLFYVMTSAFLAFFALFAGVMYPNIATLHPHASMDALCKILPAFFTPFLGIIRNWTFALFYTLANMWGSVVVSLLFWGFANEIMTVPEAKKYYPIFGLMANVALIFSGQYVKFVSSLRSGLPIGMDPWEYSLKLLMGAVCGSGVCILGTMRYIQTKVLTDPEVELPVSRTKKSKTKMSLKESFKFLSSSTYIRDLATLVIAYGMSINIVEVAWKSKLKMAFPDPNAYSAFMGNFSTATGIVTLIMMVAGRFIFSKWGWGTAALITPITLLTTGIGFFSLTLFPAFFAPITEKLGTTPLMLAVIIGAVQNILSKGAKYSLFDPAKEMAYIPLDQESKTKGKAAIDVIGNPLGKSGGSFIQQILIGMTGSLSAATGYLGAILGGIIIVWLKAAASLNAQFQKKNDDMLKEEWPLADYEKKES